MSKRPPDPDTVRRFQDDDDESLEHEETRALPDQPDVDARNRKKVEKQLDDALAATFPASDPVSIVTSQHEEDWGYDASPEERAAGDRELHGARQG